MESFQKELKSTLGGIKREQTLQKKTLEGLEKRIVENCMKRINNLQKQNKETLESIQQSLQKLEKRFDLMELNEIQTPYSIPTVRRKRRRNMNFYSQDIELKREHCENGIKSKVSEMIQSAIQTKDNSNLFLIDDFFYLVCFKNRKRELEGKEDN